MAATKVVNNSNRSTFEPDGSLAILVTDLMTTAPISPASPSCTALARFEFEAGRGNKGTKILMVEWEDPPHLRHTSSDAKAGGGGGGGQHGQWHVTWPQKTSTTLPATDHSRGDHSHRLYFLLLPDVTIPPVITLTYQPSTSPSSFDHQSTPPSSSSDATKKLMSTTSWQVNPLPAIFPPELGVSARVHGKKGVLHTLWAKKRLEELSKEIECEQVKNVEGVGLEMALQEKGWIEHHFGVVARPTGIDVTFGGGTGGAGAGAAGMGMGIPGAGQGWMMTMSGEQQDPMLSPSSPFGPGSPSTPGGGSNRLAEKLKGLRVGTSEKELTRHDPPPSSSTTKAVNQPNGQNQKQQQQHQGPSTKSTRNIYPAKVKTGEDSEDDDEEEDDEDDDLFAVAMSPRSPDMAKSPFSSLSSATIGLVGGGIGGVGGGGGGVRTSSSSNSNLNSNTNMRGKVIRNGNARGIV